MTGNRVDIADLGPIGDPVADPGGEATVYSLPHSLDQVLKRYHDHLCPRGDELDALVHWRVGLPPADRQRVDQLFMWPAATVTEGGRVVGALLPRIPANFIVTLATDGRARPCELQYLTRLDRLAKYGIARPSDADRLRACRRYVDGIALLHHHGLLFPDINEKNLLWTTAGGLAVCFIDADNARFAGSPGVLAAAAADDWYDQHASGLPHDELVERYKVGLLVYRVLTCDLISHPGPDRPYMRTPAPPFTPELAALVVESLRSDRGARPPVAAFVGPLDRALVGAATVPGGKPRPVVSIPGTPGYTPRPTVPTARPAVPVSANGGTGARRTVAVTPRRPPPAATGRRPTMPMPATNPTTPTRPGVERRNGGQAIPMPPLPASAHSAASVPPTPTPVPPAPTPVPPVASTTPTALATPMTTITLSQGIVGLALGLLAAVLLVLVLIAARAL